MYLQWDEITDNPEYCDENSTPNFKIYDFETDRLIEMISIDIPNWENLGINNISLIELNSDILQIQVI